MKKYLITIGWGLLAGFLVLLIFGFILNIALSPLELLGVSVILFLSLFFLPSIRREFLCQGALRRIAFAITLFLPFVIGYFIPFVVWIAFLLSMWGDQPPATPLSLFFGVMALFFSGL